MGQSGSSAIRSLQVVVRPAGAATVTSLQPGALRSVVSPKILEMNIERSRFRFRHIVSKFFGFQPIEFIIGPAASCSSRIHSSFSRVGESHTFINLPFGIRFPIQEELTQIRRFFVKRTTLVAHAIACAIAGGHQMDSPMTGILVQFLHQRSESREQVRAPAISVKQDHVDFLAQAEVELSFDSFRIGLDPVTPVIAPTIDFNIHQPVGSQPVFEIGMVPDLTTFNLDFTGRSLDQLRQRHGCVEHALVSGTNQVNASIGWIDPEHVFLAGCAWRTQKLAVTETQYVTPVRVTGACPVGIGRKQDLQITA